MAKQYDAVKGEWVAATKEQTAHHEAVAEGKPLPSDRTQEELDRLDPAFAGPVVTGGTEAAGAASVSAAAGTGTTGRPATGTRNP
jgi:hypothetical protein